MSIQSVRTSIKYFLKIRSEKKCINVEKYLKAVTEYAPIAMYMFPLY